MWDTSDDVTLNLQYDTSDDEDLIFVSKLNPSAVGGYGIYDYEIRVPVALRDYKNPDTTRVKFYYEIT